MNLHTRLSGTPAFIAPVFALCLAMLLGLSPSAKADTFQYVFTDPDPAASVTLVFTITAATLPPSGDVTSFTTDISAIGPITEFAWNSASLGTCLGGFGIGFGCAAYQGSDFRTIDGYPVGSFLSPGTYTGFSTTLVITDLGAVGTTEPSSLLLLGCGLFGLPIVARFGSRIRNLAR